MTLLNIWQALKRSNNVTTKQFLVGTFTSPNSHLMIVFLLICYLFFFCFVVDYVLRFCEGLCVPP